MTTVPFANSASNREWPQPAIDAHGTRRQFRRGYEASQNLREEAQKRVIVPICMATGACSAGFDTIVYFGRMLEAWLWGYFDSGVDPDAAISVNFDATIESFVLSFLATFYIIPAFFFPDAAAEKFDFDAHLQLDEIAQQVVNNGLEYRVPAGRMAARTVTNWTDYFSNLFQNIDQGPENRRNDRQDFFSFG